MFANHISTYRKSLSDFILLLFIFLCSSLYAAQPLSRSDLEHAIPHFAPVFHGVIEYYDIGHGEPIVLIAGYGSNVSGWDSQMVATLAATHRVILFDNRDVGGSIIHSNSYTSKDLANDTYELVSQLKLHKPVILGISMGGMIAQQYAVLHPDAMSKLILINTTIAGNKVVYPSLAVQRQMASIPKGMLGAYFKAVKLFFPPEWRIRMALSLLHDRFHTVFLKEGLPSHAVLLKQQALIRHWFNDNAAEQQIAQLKMPVLILNGGSDEVIPPVNSVILLKTIPHARLLRWTQGGHSMIYQFPASIVAAIDHFIGS